MRGLNRRSLAATMCALMLSLASPRASEALPPCPPGWDQGNWNNPSVQTPKYVVGRIIAAFPATPDGLRQALPAVNAKFPGSRILPEASGVLYVAGVGDIDVISGGGSWRWHVLRDECAKSGLCDPPKEKPATGGTPAAPAPGGGGSGGGCGPSYEYNSRRAGKSFTCNKWKDNLGCWCGEWTDAIWAQRHYVGAHQRQPGFVLQGQPDSWWGDWARGEVGDFIQHMESATGGSNQNCLKSKAKPNWSEVERKYWKATALSGLSQTGLAQVGKNCKPDGTSEAKPKEAGAPAAANAASGGTGSAPAPATKLPRGGVSEPSVAAGAPGAASPSSAANESPVELSSPSLEAEAARPQPQGWGGNVQGVQRLSAQPGKPRPANPLSQPTRVRQKGWEEE